MPLTPRLLVRALRTLAWLAVLTVSIFTLACGGADADHHTGAGQAAESASEPTIAVKVTPAHLDAISALYSTSATLRARYQATVIARTRGVIKQLLAEEGDRIGGGQVLAVLENDEQRIAAARSQTAAETAAREHARIAGLFKQGLVSEDEFERTRHDSEDARHALELAELELSRTSIRAPFSGVVLRRHLDPGASVSDGASVFDIADLDPLYADITIPERHVARLGVGQEVRLTADASGDRVRARIERIAPMVDPTTGTVKVTVAVQGSSSLRPGAFSRVDIITDTHEEVLIVPRSALVAEGRRWHLYRLAEGRNAVEQLEVEIGFENGAQVEIASTVGASRPLEREDLVVCVGAPALSDGAPVEVMSDEDGETESGRG